ncbi:MAG: hypothetical protein EXQ52_05350 [Bryobacterales bacterium]|nr:hypothetical protein [Bryobacterales bacterium]
MKTKEQLQVHADLLGSVTRGLDRLTSTVTAHDAQIEALMAMSEENARNWKNLERQWQVYLNTLPRN